MAQLEEKDIELIEKAKDAIARNYDGERFFHTVGAALRTKEGKVYVGVNVYSAHGACAELIALGDAITAGEREFETIAAVNGESGEPMPPCGNCRQMLSDYAPDCWVVIQEEGNLRKVPAKSLIPHSYHAQY